MVFKHALVILNPRSASASLRALEAAFDRGVAGIERRIRRLSENESAEDVAREELRAGGDVIIAAGGDGTVSGVARAARQARVPLAIAPMGTANMLAEQLGVPGNLDEAIGLLAGRAAVRSIDGLEIDGRLYFLNAGVGVSARTVQDLRDADKRRFGLPAYLLTGIASSFAFDPVLCAVSIDGRTRRLRILDVSVVNAGFRSERPVPGFPDVRPDDGRADVLVVWAPRPIEYLLHLWRAFSGWRRVRPNVQWLVAEREVEIDCDEPLPVQADGDLVGETPVTIRLVPRAVDVVVPRPAASDGP